MSCDLKDILKDLTEFVEDQEQNIQIQENCHAQFRSIEIKIPGRCPSLNKVFSSKRKEVMALKKEQRELAQKAISSLLLWIPIEGDIWTLITSVPSGTLTK